MRELIAVVLGCGLGLAGCARLESAPVAARSNATLCFESVAFPSVFDLDAPDFDGDCRSDIAVFRPSSNAWYWRNAATDLGGTVLGQPGDWLVPNDYDGDRKTDVAVFRPDTATWYILQSSRAFELRVETFGSTGDEPVPADYDGDGRTDLAVRQASTGRWSLQLSTTGETHTLTLGSPESLAVPNDYNGDQRDDPAVYDPGHGRWTILEDWRTDGLAPRVEDFGGPGGEPHPLNYDGDLRGVDLTVFNPGDRLWHIKPTDGSPPYTVAFGYASDQRDPGFYDGDRFPDLAVYRPEEGVWYIACGTESRLCRAEPFGLAEDLPVRRRQLGPR